MLTPRQRDLLEFLSGYIVHNGVAPSQDEMRAALGLRSKSGANRMLKILEERGYIRRLRDRARAIEVIAEPGAAATALREIARLSAIMPGDVAARINQLATAALGPAAPSGGASR